MARCEDWPCCGHEAGCCPDFDESGRQLNMRCTCGAVVPLGSRSSLCPACLAAGDPDDPYYGDEDDWEDDWEDDDDENWEEDDYDGQPDEAQEWHDFDPDC